MQRTEKYFEQDAFRTECESVILAAEPDEKTGGGRIALDGTVFYPEGGGQPADRGTLTLPDGTVLYSGIGLVVFMLLTAYDTQKLSQMYSYYAGDSELAEKASIYGALTLYLDFINIFLYVVRLLGLNSRRRD